MNTKHSSTSVLLLGLLIGIALLMTWMVWPFALMSWFTKQELDSIEKSYAPFYALVSGFASIGVVCALFNQERELRETERRTESIQRRQAVFQLYSNFQSDQMLEHRAVAHELLEKCERTKSYDQLKGYAKPDKERLAVVRIIQFLDGYRALHCADQLDHDLSRSLLGGYLAWWTKQYLEALDRSNVLADDPLHNPMLKQVLAFSRSLSQGNPPEGEATGA